MEENNKILIYTDSSGLTKIDVRLTEDTLWLTQTQMCELYQTSKSNVSEHIKHIFEEGELQRKKQLFGNSEQLPQTASHT